ncbi:MAG: hypothetical protein U0T82_02280 [Bacteroidales bacterium]
MITNIETTITLLRERVTENLRQINESQALIRQILQEPLSEKRTKRFEQQYGKNKTLLRENQDLISLQITLVNFLEKYRKVLKVHELSLGDSANIETTGTIDRSVSTGTHKSETKGNASELVEDARDSMFDKTINGTIPWNRYHPMFYNQDFYNRLMEYYLSVENYEACAFLSQSRDR